MITRPAVRALHEFSNAANRYDGNEEEDCDEAHALFHNEVGKRAAVAALDRMRRPLRTPRQIIRSNDDECQAQSTSRRCGLLFRSTRSLLPVSLLRNGLFNLIKGVTAWITGRAAQVFLDSQKLVVLSRSVRA